MFTFGPASRGAGDPLFDNVVLLVQAAGAVSSTALTDKSKYAHPITYFTGAGMSSAQAWPSGSGVSLAMPNRHEVTDNAAFDFGTGDWTIELMAYFPSAGGGLMFGIPYATGDLGIGANSSFGDLDFIGPSGTGRSAVALPRNEWVYVVRSRASDVDTIWAKGIQHRSASAGGITINMVSTLRIGGVNGSTNATSGYLDSIRITRGVARYTAASPPPATLLAPFPAA